MVGLEFGWVPHAPRGAPRLHRLTGSMRALANAWVRLGGQVPSALSGCYECTMAAARRALPPPLLHYSLGLRTPTTQAAPSVLTVAPHGCSFAEESLSSHAPLTPKRWQLAAAGPKGGTHRERPAGQRWAAGGQGLAPQPQGTCPGALHTPRLRVGGWVVGWCGVGRVPGCGLEDMMRVIF